MPSYLQGRYLWASTICTGSMGPLTLRIPYLQVIHTGQTFKKIYIYVSTLTACCDHPLHSQTLVICLSRNSIITLHPESINPLSLIPLENDPLDRPPPP